MGARDNDEIIVENKMAGGKTMDIRRTILACMTLVVTIALVACTTAEPNPPPAPDSRLLDTEWELVSLNGGALIEGRVITLRFAEASLEGSGGCNTYGGSYTASEDRLSVTGVYATEMACMEPEGIMDQEQAYFQVLNTVTRYRVDGDQLELYDEAGSPILAFVATGG
jgi:heat shock protein HslJ